MSNIKTLLSTAARWDQNYYKALHKAIREHGGMKSGLFLALLFREDCYDFNAVNLKARRIWRRKLMRVVSENAEGLMDGGAIMMATFVDRDWAICDQFLQFDLPKAKQKVRNAMKGMNYIAVFEPGYYVNRTWTIKWWTGNLISWHCHCIVWGKSESTLRRHKRKSEGSFKPIDAGGSFPVLNNLRTVLDLLRAVRYATKMPVEGYFCNWAEDGKVTQKSAPLKTIHHYRMFSLLRKYELPKMWFGGGEGAEILKKTREAVYATIPKIGWLKNAHESPTPF